MPEQTVIYGTSEKTTNKTYPIEIDAFSGALQTIDMSHHHVHEGDSFHSVDSLSVGSAVTTDYLIVAPNSEYLTNIIFEVNGTLSCTVSLYETTDKTGAVEITPFNLNRNIADAALTKLYKGLAGGTTDGTLLYTLTIGSTSLGDKIGGVDRGTDEIVLKKNTKYILRVLSNAASNRINVKFSWYEHPPFYIE